MATNAELHSLLAKAAASKTFRDKVAADPDAAAKSIGITLDQAQLKAFKDNAAKIKASNSDLKISDKVAKLLAIWV